MTERPTLRCCVPIMGWFPSGAAWRHSFDCKVARGQKVDSGYGSALKVWLAHPTGCGCADCLYIEAHIDDLDDDFGVVG